MRLFACHLVPLALPLLSGCASVPDGGEVVVPVPSASADDARRIGDAAEHERVALAPDTLPGTSDVLVGAAYVAASGRRCRRLLAAPSGEPLERVACGAGDRWHIVRSLSPRTVPAHALSATSIPPFTE